MMFPKVRAVHDPKALKACRKRACDNVACGLNHREPPHHFVRRSHLHLDLPENLLSLCWDCHRRVHDGEREIELEIMAKRDTEALRAMTPTYGGWMLLDDYRERGAA